MKLILFFQFLIISVMSAFGQGCTVKGYLDDPDLSQFTILLDKRSVKLNQHGIFHAYHVSSGLHRLRILSKDFEEVQLEINVGNEALIDLGRLNGLLKRKVNHQTILLDDFDTTEEQANFLIGNPNKTLSSFKAFEWSDLGFQPYGLSYHQDELSINGMVFKDLSRQVPFWSLLRSMSIPLKSRVHFSGLSPNSTQFGGLRQTTHFSTFAKRLPYRPQINLVFTNGRYQRRVEGLLPVKFKDSPFALAFAFGLRKGFVSKSQLNFNHQSHLFLSLDYERGQHFANLSAFFCPSTKSHDAYLSQLQVQLYGKKHNPNWGAFKGVHWFAKTSGSKRPVLLLTYQHKADLLTFHSSFGTSHGNNFYRFLKHKNAPNPLPNYHRNLGEKQQINWGELLRFNQHGSFYSLIQDNRRIQKYFGNFRLFLNKNNFSGTIGVFHDHQFTQFYGEIHHLLGSEYFEDKDPFSERVMQRAYQNKTTADRIDHHSEMNQSESWAFLHFNWTTSRFECHFSSKWSFHQLNFQQHFDNGFKEKSTQFDQLSYGLKSNAYVQLNHQNHLRVDAFYESRLNLSDQLINPKYSAQIHPIPPLRQLSIQSQHNGQFEWLKTHVNFYWINTKNENDRQLFYTQNYSYQDFVYQFASLTSNRLGVEYSLGVDLNSMLSIEHAGNIGHYWYSENAPFTQYYESVENYLAHPSRIANIKHHYLATPNHCFGLKVSYQSGPLFINYSANLVGGNYPKLSLVRRSPFFMQRDFKPSGQLTLNEEALSLLEQHPLKSILSHNLSIGRWWRFKSFQFFVLASLRNITNQTIAIRAREQNRLSNFNLFHEDITQNQSIFGNQFRFHQGRRFFIYCAIKL